MKRMFLGRIYKKRLFAALRKRDSKGPQSPTLRGMILLKWWPLILKSRSGSWSFIFLNFPIIEAIIEPWIALDQLGLWIGILSAGLLFWFAGLPESQKIVFILVAHYHITLYYFTSHLTKAKRYVKIVNVVFNIYIVIVFWLLIQ